MAKKKYVYVTAEEVREAVEKMIEEYYENGTIPTDFRLLEITKASPRTLDRWYSGEKDRDTDEAAKDTFKAAMDRLVQFRSQICVEEIAANPKASGWIFLSKQARWGGFQDGVQRFENKGSQDIKITIAGADGKPLKHG